MNTKSLLYLTIKVSLIIQILTGILDAYALTLNYKGDLLLIKGLIVIELIVQFIEIIFYYWFYTGFNDIKNATPKRYYDWIITTPSMLFILIVYLDYLKNNSKVPEIDGDDKTTYDYIAFSFEKNKHNFWIILILNFFMLVFGYLGETNIINKLYSFTFGFLFFVAYFYYIYDNYAKYTNFGILMITLFASIWALYGFASLLSYNWKNISYNILDIISKNFFGIFLAYVGIKNAESF